MHLSTIDFHQLLAGRHYQNNKHSPVTKRKPQLTILKYVHDRLPIIFCHFAGTCIDYWKMVRDNYRRALMKMIKWETLRRSCGVEHGRKPKPYKYAAEMSFLDEIFRIESYEEMDDPMAKDSSASDEDEMVYLFLVYKCLLMFLGVQNTVREHR